MSPSSGVVTDRARFRDVTGALDDWSFVVLVLRVAGEVVKA